MSLTLPATVGKVRRSGKQNANSIFALHFHRFYRGVCNRSQAHSRGLASYFYYWIFAVLFISLWDIARHLNVYSPSFRSESVNHEALVLAVFPRLFVYPAVAAVAIVLLVKKEWVWVERLRVVL
jgi:hypothetical protein